VNTSNFHGEYPHWVARTVPYLLMYRPVPVRPVSARLPPVPVVVE
jgi:hypothetical protein